MRAPMPIRSLLARLGESPALLVVLSTLLSIGVAYLLEEAILNSVASVLRGRNVWLLVTAVFAALAASILWGWAAYQSMRRGVFIHAVADPRLARHAGEDALLRSWVRNRWPRAVVMSYRPIDPVEGQWEVDAAALGRRVLGHAYVARVLLPAAQGLTILPGGQPHLLVLAGAVVADGLQGDDRRLRLLADDTSDERQPFVEFELGGLKADGAPTPGMDAGTTIVLILRETEAEAAESARSDASAESESVAGYRALHHAAPVLIVKCPELIPETREGYRAVLRDFASQLEGLQGVVLIQGNVPASILFAAGLLARSAGLDVGSFPHRDGYVISDQAVSEAPSDMESGTRRFEPAARLKSRWWCALIGGSLLAGCGVPLLGGSAALFVEWFVARSQESVQFADWGQAAACGAVAIFAIWLRRRVMNGIEAPSVVISPRQMGRDTVRKRSLRIPGDIAQASSVELAQWVNEAFCDVLTALPDIDDVTVDLSECPNGRSAIDDQRRGLTKSLRGNRPVTFRRGASGVGD